MAVRAHSHDTFTADQADSSSFVKTLAAVMPLGSKIAARIRTGSTEGSSKVPGPSSPQDPNAVAGASARPANAASAGSAATATAAASAESSAAQGTMPPPPHGRLDRQYSTASWNTVTTLQQLELEFEAMREASARADATLSHPPADGLPPGLRNELAQLHGDANKLLATRLDAILTGA